MAFLDHRELKIIKGIGPVPGDTASAEQQPVVVNLMDDNGGIALDGTNGAWSPQIPAVKPLWAENPANDGRTLIAGALNNVTETMRLIITGSDAVTVYSNLRRLYDIRQDALDFWQTEKQTEPVYIKWWANCGTGPQFALIYTMDIAPEFMNSERPAIQVTLTIEREFGWRGIPPGANPKLWVFDNKLNSSNASLMTGTDSLINATIQNRQEYTVSTNPSSGRISQNFVEIPASLIPGDLPALVELTAIPVVAPSEHDSVMIGVSSKPTSLKDPAGNVLDQCYIFNACDASATTDTSITNDATGPKSVPTGNNQRADCTFATVATMSGRLSWDVRRLFDSSLTRGRFAVFVRARVSATPTVIALQATYTRGGFTITTPQATVSSNGGGLTKWMLVYLGTIGIPQDSERIAITPTGLGVDVNNVPLGNVASSLTLSAARTSGANNLQVADIFLLPMDECAITLEQSVMPGSPAFLYDNSDYMSRGREDSFSALYTLSGTLPQLTGGFQKNGQDLMLNPQTTNRVYFLFYGSLTKLTGIVSTTYTIRLNIVPRWSGVRDA